VAGVVEVAGKDVDALGLDAVVVGHQNAHVVSLIVGTGRCGRSKLLSVATDPPLSLAH
jgi:hypothetical protein